jgi:hypothetical protein
MAAAVRSIGGSRMIEPRAGPWNCNAAGEKRSGYGVEIIGESVALERVLKQVETVRKVRADHSSTRDSRRCRQIGAAVHGRHVVWD